MAKVTRSRERGLYIVLFAIMMTALIILIALSVGLGLIAVNSTRTQQIANVAALAALEEYINRRGAVATPPLPEALANDAATKAETILRKNKLLRADNELGRVIRSDQTPANDTSGVITPGSWFTAPPGTGGDPCSGIYPCFVPIPAYNQQPPADLPINSVRIEVFNQTNNPILAPFASILGYAGFQTKASATAAIVQRCAAYLLDLSESSILDSHPIAPNPWDPTAAQRRDAAFPAGFCRSGNWGNFENSVYLPCPTGASMFALRKEGLDGLASPTDPPSLCYFPPSFGGTPAVTDPEGELITWCNVAWDSQPGGGFRSERVRPSRATPGIYKEDFWELSSPFGIVWMDLYNRPEPLNSFFFAFNAGLREVRRQSTAGDLGVVIPFTGDTRRRIPRTGMTSNIDYLVQLTNMDNVGRISSSTVAPTLDTSVEQASPNFVEAGWFPLRGTGDNDDRYTDIVSALREAINVLQTECSPIAQKAIILATDGLTTCAPGRVPQCPPTRDYPTYQDARNQLLVAGPGGTASVLRELQENRIVLTTLLAGASVQPHFRRQAGGSYGEFLAPREAYLNGLDPGVLFNAGFSGASSAQQAFENSGQAGVVFQDPNLVFGTMSLSSGGHMCPLLPRCQSADCPACTGSCYGPPPPGSPPGTPEVLRDCARTPIDDILARPLRTCSPFNESTGEQAARCVIRTLGGNPYILVQ